MNSTASMPATPGGEPVALDRRQVRVVFAGLLLVMLLAALDSTIVATALPTIVTELGGVERLAWVITAYLLAQTVVTPLYGKLGDLYGRKVVLQVAIVLFLAGSALCGLSGSMMQLVLFRAVQGLGGGGLITTAQAAVGDVVPPRERARYQGVFGAVFAVSSIAGPLIGGFFTTHLSWRWIFYINLPLGVLALFVLAATLPARKRRVHHDVDYSGAALLGAALSGIVLVSDLGGTQYPWTSAPIVGLGLITVLALAAFIVVERRAAEPMLPLRLFRDRTFTLSSAVGFIIGVTLFGSVTYLPLFLQMAKGSTPTMSGLQLAPMMGGTLLSSIVSGQIISRRGRYRFFPIAGTLVATFGLFLLSRISVATPLPQLLAFVAVIGLGLGMVMQVLVIAVQNTVAYADLGVATSGTMLFRLIGGSIGTAVLGSIFSARLAASLSHSVNRPLAYTSALTTVFAIAATISFLGFVLTWLIPEKKLRESIAASAGDLATEAVETFGSSTGGDSVDELLRGLRILADRDAQRAHMEAILARAGSDLTPAAALVLIRADEDKTVDLKAVARRYHVPMERLEQGLAQLHAQRLIENGHLTTDGCDALDRIMSARRARLAEVSADWPEAQREQLATILRRLALDLAPDAHREA